MCININDAPMGKPLILLSVTDTDLEERLNHLGLFYGSRIMRLEQEVQAETVRIIGPGGAVVFSGSMAMRTVVHLNDGRRLPLSEMSPGETGHIEGRTGGKTLAETFDAFGLKPDDPIQCERRLPPMDYVAVIENSCRVRLTEGMCAKIWGRMAERNIQFVSARTGEIFYVEKILGGKSGRDMFLLLGIIPGKKLVLEKVAQAGNLRIGKQTTLVIVSREGLRLFLDKEDAKHISVRNVRNDESVSM